jgi:hypothetical protein
MCIISMLLPLAYAAQNVRSKTVVIPLPTEPFRAEGTYVGATPDGFQLLTDMNQTWMISVLPPTKVELTGTATPDYLHPGQQVRFSGEVEKGGEVKEKVNKLTIISPSPDSPPGVFPPIVSGQITGVSGNKVTLRSGKVTVKIELGEEAKIDVKFSDGSLARQGDKVSVRGEIIAGRPGFGFASDVKIAAASPFTSGKTKPSKPAAKKDASATKNGSSG